MFYPETSVDNASPWFYQRGKVEVLKGAQEVLTTSTDPHEEEKKGGNLLFYAQSAITVISGRGWDGAGGGGL